MGSACDKACSTVGDSEPRKFGCQRPFHKLQILSWAVHIFVVGGFVGILFTALVNDFQDGYVPVLIIYFLSLTVLILSYAYCLLSDPAKPSPIGLDCKAIVKNNRADERYCRVCKKKIPGLDHHCEWLGTCIGESNYFAFFSLISSGLITFLLQLVILILQITLFGVDGAVFYAFTGIWCFISAFISFRYLSLLIFHVNLLRMGMGTYDYLIVQRDQMLAKEQAKKQQEQGAHYTA